MIMRSFVVRKHERGLMFRRGDFERFLDPGIYRFMDPYKRVTVDLYDLTVPRFGHRLADYLVSDHADEVAERFTVVETGATEVAIVYRDGKLSDIVGPDKRMLYWKGVVETSAMVVDVSEDFVVDPAIAKMLITDLGERRVSVADKAIYAREVPEGHCGLLYVDGKLTGALEPGLHAFWKAGRGIAVELVDLRVRTLEVGGQEILTRDKVSLRINVTATYCFADALKATQAVKDPLDYLYKEIQFGLRAAVGTANLDTLLEDKGAVDRAVFDHVRERFAAIGVDVTSVGVKDIILPGDMKDILGKVVEATKVAQANVIRRREETNATRSLLNTAKVMEDNPVALRLKELEMLEKVTDKIGNISVYGGLDGVLSELVKIRN